MPIMPIKVEIFTNFHDFFEVFRTKIFGKPIKDFGPDAVTPLTIRAKYIEIADGGELWIGSRKCRYQGKADIVLYGNKGDMPSHTVVGEKYLWTDTNGTLEIHGKEKKSWTKA